MHNYPSDISRSQFAIISPILESSCKTTSPRTVDLYDVFCGILYVLKKWVSMENDTKRLSELEYLLLLFSTLEQEKRFKIRKCIWGSFKKTLVQKVRILDNRKEKTTFTIVDAQSVKNTDTAKNKGCDAGKKVSGIKRHIAVDSNGLTHAIYVSTADVTDRNGAIEMLKKHNDNLSQVQNILVDAVYVGEKFANSVSKILGCTVELVKRSEMHIFKVIPKRWVVERSFSWLDKCRRLWKNCERYLHTSLQMMVLAFSVLLVKRL